MGKTQETVLYYHGGKTLDSRQVRLLKSVLIQMGVRIKNIRPEQAEETVGCLAGITQLKKEEKEIPKEGEKAGPNEENPGEKPAGMDQDVLILHQFTGGRIDQLLLGLKKAGVPKIGLKAVITPENAGWTFSHLYEELKKEHEAFAKQDER